MGSLFGGSKSPAPAPPPSRDDTQVKAAAEAERKRLLAKKGRKSTIKTGGQGVTDEAPAAKKKLLGGGN